MRELGRPLCRPSNVVVVVDDDDDDDALFENFGGTMNNYRTLQRRRFSTACSLSCNVS